MSSYVSIIVLVDADAWGEGPEDRLSLNGEAIGEVIYAAAFDGADPAFLWADGMAPAHSDDCARAIADYEERMDEWAYGHDCEAPETDTPRDTVADVLNRHGIPHTIGPNGLRVTSQDSAESERT